MHTVVVGLNYKTTKVKNREKIYFSSNKMEDALKQLINYPSIQECVILSTCNRVEIYAVGENIEMTYDSIIKFISDYHSIREEDIRSFLYKHNCSSAVNHLFRVVSSLDSMIVGEYEILGQVKFAYESAQMHKTTKEYLNKLFQTAIHTGKRVRTETAIGKGAISIGSVTANLVKEIFHEQKNINVLLIGAGEVAELTATNLNNKLDCNITISNRSKSKSEELAKKFNASIVEFENKKEIYFDQDIIIASTSSNEYIIKKEDFSSIIANQKKIFLIDLSVPRNIDPEIEKIDNNIFLFTIDDLESKINFNFDERFNEILRTELIISDSINKYLEWYSKQAIIPIMREIKHEFELMQRGLFNCYKKALGDIDTKQTEIINQMMKEYGEKIIKTIMVGLNEVTDSKTLHDMGDLLKLTLRKRGNENKSIDKANFITLDSGIEVDNIELREKKSNFESHLR